MASAISESATYEASVIAPDAGDAVTAAAIRTPVQDVSNRTKFIYETILSSLTAVIFGYQALVDQAAEELVTVGGFAKVLYLGTIANNNVKALSLSPTPKTGALVVLFRDNTDARTVEVLNGTGGSTIHTIGTGQRATVVYAFNGTAWIRVFHYEKAGSLPYT